MEWKTVLGLQSRLQGGVGVIGALHWWWASSKLVDAQSPRSPFTSPASPSTSCQRLEHMFPGLRAFADGGSFDPVPQYQRKLHCVILACRSIPETSRRLVAGYTPAIVMHSTHFQGEDCFVKLAIPPSDGCIPSGREIPETGRFQLRTSAACLGRIHCSHRQEKATTHRPLQDLGGTILQAVSSHFTTTLEWLSRETEFPPGDG